MQKIHDVLHSTLCLAGRDLRSRHNVAVEVVVDVGGVPGVGRLDMSRNLGGRGEGLGATTGDLDLSAGDVELRWGAGVVNCELLDA